MNVKQVIHRLQTMIDTGAIAGEEKFGVYEYSPDEGSYFRSPDEDEFEAYIDEDTDEVVVYF